MPSSLLHESLNEGRQRIDGGLFIRKHEKDQLGEVLTPSKLIDELCDHLPKTVWTNPDLKWLDPAAGTGNFMSIIFHRLNSGLAKWQPNEAKRHQHILSNMIYQVELNSSSVKKLKQLFGATTKIVQGDFLQEGVMDKLGLGPGGVDVMVGNPPFQRGMAEKRGTNAGRRTLWDIFVEKGLSTTLKKGGYLAFITPGGWRGTGRHSELGELMKSRQIIYLRMAHLNTGRKDFGVSTRYDAYVIRNLPSKMFQTEIIDEDNQRHRLNLANWPFIPGGCLEEFKDLIHEGPHTGKRVPYYDSYHHPQKTRRVKPRRTRKYKHPVVHSIGEKGLTYWYSMDGSKEGRHGGRPKVILNLNGQQYAYPEQNDYKGELGMTILSFGIPTSGKQDGERVLRAVETPLFKDLIKASKWGAFQTDYRMFRHFRDDWPEWILRHKRKMEGCRTHLGHKTRRTPSKYRRVIKGGRNRTMKT